MVNWHAHIAVGVEGAQIRPLSHPGSRPGRRGSGVSVCAPTRQAAGSVTTGKVCRDGLSYADVMTHPLSRS